MIINEKKFDCVEFMRNIRDKHREEYKRDPELREKRLKIIREKYGFAKQQRTSAR